MTGRQKIMVAVAGLHLLVVTYNAFRLPAPSPANRAGLAFRWYGAMSGASNSYGFFKAVGNNCRVRFYITDHEDKSWEDVLNRSDNHEAEMRYNSSTYMIVDFGDHVVKHWAATMFGRHPSARQVFVIFEEYAPPSMEEFRAGKRGQWLTTYPPKAFFRKDQISSPSEGERP